jgi:hypothetical protein
MRVLGWGLLAFWGDGKDLYVYLLRGSLHEEGKRMDWQFMTNILITKYTVMWLLDVLPSAHSSECKFSFQTTASILP